MEQDELFAKQAEPQFYRLFHELVSLPEVRARFGWSTDVNSFADADKARQFFELICSDGKEDPKLQTHSDVRKLKNVIGNSKAEVSLFDTDEPLSEAIRIGEQGKKSVDVAGLLDEAKSSLAGINLLQAQNLKSENITVIQEILDLLTRLKAMAANADK
jgi:hypothetical protein